MPLHTLSWSEPFLLRNKSTPGLFSSTINVSVSIATVTFVMIDSCHLLKTANLINAQSERNIERPTNTLNNNSQFTFSGVLAVTTRTLAGTSEISTKAFAILPNALVVLASAA